MQDKTFVYPGGNVTSGLSCYDIERMRNSLPKTIIMISNFKPTITWNKKYQINGLYEKHTGMPFDTVENILEQYNFITCQETSQFAFIHKVLTKQQSKWTKGGLQWSTFG